MLVWLFACPNRIFLLTEYKKDKDPFSTNPTYAAMVGWLSSAEKREGDTDELMT
jgi:hypothetical protein